MPACLPYSRELSRSVVSGSSTPDRTASALWRDILRPVACECTPFWAFPPAPDVRANPMGEILPHCYFNPIFLSTSEVELHFTCTLAICVSFSLISMSISFVRFPPIGCFSFQLWRPCGLGCESSVVCTVRVPGPSPCLCSSCFVWVSLSVTFS